MPRNHLAPLFFCALILLSGTALAAGSGSEDGGKPAAIELSRGVQDMILNPTGATSEPVTGVRLNITQFSYPGVPERAACRTVIRVENQSASTVAFYTLIRTFDLQEAPLSTWMTPSGILAPGQSGERLYSCKIARYMVLDRGSASGWPNTCHVDGIDRTPCPIQLTFDSNIDFSPNTPLASPPNGAKH